MKKVLFTDCVDIVGESCKAFDGVKKYVSTGAVDVDHIDENDVEWVDYKGKPSRADLVVQPGDVLFAKMQGTEKTLQIDDTNADSIYSTGFFALRPKPGILTQRCLYYLLRSQAFLSLKDKNCSGATQKAITNTGLKKIFVSIPDYHEQDSVTAQLDLLSTIIKLRQMELQKLDELVKSQFIEMFGDPVVNSKNYPVHCLSEHILFLTSGSRGWAQYYCDDGEWFITIKNVKNCRITVDDVQCVSPPHNAEAERTRLQEGDLLISITADLGRTGVVTKEIAEHGAYNNQHLTSIRLDQTVLDPLYVAFFMESEAGKRQFEEKNMSAVKAGLNFDAIKSLRLLVPPLEEQKRFVEFVAQCDKSKVAVKKAFDSIQLLFECLVNTYFTQ